LNIAIFFHEFAKEETPQKQKTMRKMAGG